MKEMQQWKKWAIYLVSFVAEILGLLAIMGTCEDSNVVELLVIKGVGILLLFLGLRIFSWLEERGCLPKAVERWIAGEPQDLDEEEKDL